MYKNGKHEQLGSFIDLFMRDGCYRQTEPILNIIWESFGSLRTGRSIFRAIEVENNRICLKNYLKDKKDGLKVQKYFDPNLEFIYIPTIIEFKNDTKVLEWNQNEAEGFGIPD